MKRVLPGESFTTLDALIARGSSLADVCDKLIKTQHLNISPVDADMGIMFNEYCTSWGNPTIDSLGDALYRKVKATQQFIRKIKEEIPDIVIENCSSGGHRLVYSMMELVSQASFSDAHETLAIPVIAANMHRVIQPAQSQIWAVLRAKDDADRLNYSLTSTFLGRMCLSGDIYDLTAQQLSLVEEAVSFYRKAAQIIRSGKTTRIECSTESYNHPNGQQDYCRVW